MQRTNMNVDQAQALIVCFIVTIKSGNVQSIFILRINAWSITKPAKNVANKTINKIKSKSAFLIQTKMYQNKIIYFCIFCNKCFLSSILWGKHNKTKLNKQKNKFEWTILSPIIFNLLVKIVESWHKLNPDKRFAESWYTGSYINFSILTIFWIIIVYISFVLALKNNQNQ